MKSDLETELLHRAREAGFTNVRIARADLPAHYGDTLKTWVDAGMHGEMAYMERTSRMRAQGAEGVLPGARSVIVFAASYWRDDDSESHDAAHLDVHRQEELTARVAKYALGQDYHLVFRERLQPIVDWLDAKLPGNKWRICVDSAPLNERAYAVESGIGFMGRNTMVIAPGSGSYLLLAEIVTTAELQPDLPIEGTCGTCTRCIDACPTNAITQPLKVDATRCISYLTIEKRSGLTETEHQMSGEWAFGCDICQDVCPYNKAPEPASMQQLAAAIVHEREPLSTFSSLGSNRDFEKRFARSPLLRAGKRRVQERARRIAEPSEVPSSSGLPSAKDRD
jgi:epoxyqueuosine reductase